ncbi:MAG TPA: hypothetical protein VFI96_08340 [Longimicrobiaceae bacterium]|nr:hypothetical protein [Longimicrobiaceae bacterium]
MIHTLVEFAAVYCGAAVVGYGMMASAKQRLAHEAQPAPASSPSPARAGLLPAPQEQAA